MSYAMNGKIAGYGRLPAPFNRGLRGLGDAQYDAAYAAYKADLAAWNAEAALRVQAVTAQQKQILAIAVYQSRANAAARAAGAVIPAGYSGCVSQTQHNAWQYECNAQNAQNAAWASATVKGLGGSTTPSGPYCALSLLPVCASPPAPIPPLRPKPLPPIASAPSAPAAPKPVIVTAPAASPVLTPAHAPAAAPPVLNTAPQQIASNSPVVATVTPPTPQSAGLVRNGLLLIVLGGASYALYRTFKKPKAAA